MTFASYSRAAERGEARLSPLGVFDDPRYAQMAVERANDYQGAAPFPNIFAMGLSREYCRSGASKED
jgi:hypothetical protein